MKARYPRFKFSFALLLLSSMGFAALPLALALAIVIPLLGATVWFAIAEDDAFSENLPPRTYTTLHGAIITEHPVPKQLGKTDPMDVLVHPENHPPPKLERPSP